jgi:hypothetical protein
MIEDWLSTEWPLIVFVFLLYVFYIVAFLSGRSEARKVISERAGAVRIAFKASAKQQDNPDLTDSNAKGKLSLATQTKDLVILFDRIRRRRLTKHLRH